MVREAIEAQARERRDREAVVHRNEQRAWAAHLIEQKRAAARSEVKKAAEAIARKKAAERQHAYIRAWLAEHPTKNDAACRAAIQKAGLGEVTIKVVSGIRRSMPEHPTNQRPARNTTPNKRAPKRPAVRVRSTTDAGPRCPACDIVPDTMTGNCRCS
ncbi:hypothetical protein ACFXHA_43060 [Nocardia sp. NPDC059240]|uniref:hypothetical protein n=1 Tax=Nocardia sp. NPDC059240 TaxID=3346786 RepID=UPI0036B34401